MPMGRLLILFLIAIAAPSPAGAEPLRTVNHSPVWLGLLFPAPDSPTATPEGAWRTDISADYSSIFMNDSRAGWDFKFDMELAQATLRAARGLSPELEAGFEFPVYHQGGGFMDDAILDYHRMFGFPDYVGQRAAPSDRYRHYVDHNGTPWRSAPPHRVTPGDATFWLKREVDAFDAAGAAVKLLAQAPTASTDGGLGNGAWEYAAFFIVAEALDGVEGTLNMGLSVPGYIDRGERYTLNPYVIMNVAAEYRWTARFIPEAQFTFATSPYGPGAPEMWQWAWMAVTVGARWITDGGRALEFSLTEDLSFTAPDFTVHFNYPF